MYKGEMRRPYGGQRLESSVGSTCIVVLEPGSATVAPTSGGRPMRPGRYLPCSGTAEYARAAEPAVAGSTYRDPVTGMTVLCVRSGPGVLAVHGRELVRVPRAVDRARPGRAGGWHAADTARSA